LLLLTTECHAAVQQSALVMEYSYRNSGRRSGQNV